MRYPQSREFYIKKGSLKISDKQSDAVVYVYETCGALYAMGFCGKRQKPDFHYRYSTQQKRTKAVETYFTGRRASLVAKADWTAKQKERRNAPIKLELGTVLTGSWGYDQTNVEAWQVVGFVGKSSVQIRRVGLTNAGGDGLSNMAEYVIPCPDSFVGDEIVTKRVTDGNCIRCDHYNLRPWEGRKLYSSWYA